MDTALEAKIAAQFGQSYLDLSEVGPVPPVGAVVLYHDIVDPDSARLQLATRAAIVIESDPHARPGSPVTIRVFMPDGQDRTVRASITREPHPYRWGPREADPGLIRYAEFNRPRQVR